MMEANGVENGGGRGGGEKENEQKIDKTLCLGRSTDVRAMENK